MTDIQDIKDNDSTHSDAVREILFFQAEDGIPDTSVTGVQTCALPIWFVQDQQVRLVDQCLGEAEALDHALAESCDRFRLTVGETDTLEQGIDSTVEFLGRDAGEPRSEERRVGKERRAGEARELEGACR